ncbi:hypothetical protein ACFY12_08705 [Streptomyces sp. NPDC001339]|uniref:hypothetical protein n=1 Tax=Streptomyces sp. NPDC001339 TaxID=3364563 RepID=UPI0036A9A886
MLARKKKNRQFSANVVITTCFMKELFGTAHIGVTAGVHAHVRLRLQRRAIDILSDALAEGDDSEEPPPSAVVDC